MTILHLTFLLIERKTYLLRKNITSQADQRTLAAGVSWTGARSRVAGGLVSEEDSNCSLGLALRVTST